MIATTIRSVLAQSFAGWEMIIVDDGSKDNTADVIRQYNDSRIRYIYQQNAERSAARNNGIEHARGEFVCFLDSDDEYLPEHLQYFYDFIKIKNSEPAFYYAPSYIADGGLKTMSRVYDGIQHPAVWAWHALLQNCGVCVPRFFLTDQKFPTQFNVWEDMHLWLRLLVKYKFYQLPEPLAIVHFHDNRSINDMFETVDMARIDKYAEAVNDLFIHHGEQLKPVLTNGMRKAFIAEKYMTFAAIVAQAGQLGKFLAITKRVISYQPSRVLSLHFIKIKLIVIKNAIL